MAAKVETFKQWTLHDPKGIESLVYGEAAFPKTEDLGEHDVLVKLHAASLNYRDLAITRVSPYQFHILYPFLQNLSDTGHYFQVSISQLTQTQTQGTKTLQIAPGVVPGSDGAGEVISIGRSVTAFKIGDKVVTHMTPQIPATQYPTMEHIRDGLGQTLNGTLQEYGVFMETGLVHMPKNLTFEEAATLTCSGLTAWNVLFGGGRKLKKEDSILTQGTGGVSVAALQVSFFELLFFGLLRGLCTLILFYFWTETQLTHLSSPMRLEQPSYLRQVTPKKRTDSPPSAHPKQ